MRAMLFLLALVAMPGSAYSQEPSAANQIGTVIAQWYEELKKRDQGQLYSFTSPGFINASPHYHHLDTGSAKLGPRHYTSLAATALQFAYDIDFLRINADFARVQVWERGYFYAALPQTTYELAAGTTFVLERRQQDGRWLILAHQSSRQGIPPNKITHPLPDMRALYYATEGKGRDAAADAANAGKW